MHEIAIQELYQEGKGNVVQEVNETINFLAEKDATRPLDMISCWMDEIKDEGGMGWSGIFHYTDIPLIEDNIIVNLPPDGNVTGAIVFFTYIP